MKIFMSGATGAMGQVISDLVADREGMEIVAGLGMEASQESAYPIYSEMSQVKEDFDIIIDFSTPKVLDDLLTYALNNQTPLILASTGYSDEEEAKIEEASKDLAILHAKNMSLGVNVMEVVAKELAQMLENFDIEIIEKHHRNKVDSPSGTAKMLFDAVNEGRGQSLEALNGRAGMYEDKRQDNEVGIAAVRGGSIVGEHTVLFAGEDEVVEIRHTAFSKKIFANGALQAASFLVNQPAGFYNMHDVLKGE